MHPKKDYLLWKEMILEGGSWDTALQYCEADVKATVDLYNHFAKSWQLTEEDLEVTLEDIEFYSEDVVLTYSNDSKVHISIYDFENNLEEIKQMDYNDVIKEYALEVVE